MIAVLVLALALTAAPPIEPTALTRTATVWTACISASEHDRLRQIETDYGRLRVDRLRSGAAYENNASPSPQPAPTASTVPGWVFPIVAVVVLISFGVGYTVGRARGVTTQ